MQQAALEDGSGGQMALPAPGVAPQVADAEQAALTAEINDGIDVAQIEGQVKASSLKKIGDLVQQHPEESVSILRNWLHEGA